MELLWYIIAVLVYPLLSMFENVSWYGKLFVQKSPGEVKRSQRLLESSFYVCAVGLSTELRSSARWPWRLQGQSQNS